MHTSTGAGIDESIRQFNVANYHCYLYSIRSTYYLQNTITIKLQSDYIFANTKQYTYLQIHTHTARMRTTVQVLSRHILYAFFKLAISLHMLIPTYLCIN